jgi:hypothetical protein
MTARLCIIAIVVAALALPASASAHNVGWPIHKAICVVTGCSDPPPRPGPQTECTPDRVGDVERIWDERLGAYVEWECRSDGKWYRLRIVQRAALPWEPPNTRYVIDYHRACKSVVCKKVAVGHRYPTKWLFGR